MLRARLFATVVVVLTATTVTAADPQPAAVNLDDLKYAVEQAEKKGVNVGLISDALVALEKALAQPTFKAGQAPPELTALRQAVEAAHKKGEDVDAISKELGRIEKALTGREFERPTQPEKKFEPLPPMRGGRGGARVVINGIAFENAVGVTTQSITIVNDTFTIRARRNNVSYTIVGALAGNDPPKIIIQDDKQKIETTDPKEVPEDYRATVESLLKSIKR
ncbi:MAG: hypothetical protein RMJ56_01640 [Gemmataceae bacterium]|nr:hypothetical protein [Gemmata sp.]MDW8196285.1 hypothetical protein [Gemmataceae bacterium]